MVKIDFNRDYYSDLGLTSDATEADIKKQFRKLALQYHPDRNRGNEQEANDKFQIIGAAHEILSDPSQRAKYNAGRAQYTSRFPRASGVRGNPWANAGSQFQPPPKRGNPRPASTSARPTAPPPTGTGRFSNFATGMPPTAKQSNSTDGLKSAYTAWKNMRQSQENPSRKPTAPPPPPRASASDKPQPVPRTPTAKARSEAAFGTGRKGFDTRSHGDDVPVSSSNYSTGGRRTAPMYGDLDDSSDEFRPSPPPRPKRTPIPREKAFVDISSDSEPERPNMSERPKFPTPRRRATGRLTTSSADATTGSSRDGGFGTAAGSASSTEANKPSNIFGFGVFAESLPKDPKPATFTRSNTDNIETQFSPRTMEGFTFSAGGGFASMPGSKASSPIKSGFDPAHWSAELGNANVFAPPPPTRVSPTRPTSRRPTVSRRSGSVDSMDIDSPPTGATPRGSMSSGPSLSAKEQEQAAHARNVPVEPAKKEWRSGELGGKPTRRKTGGSYSHSASSSLSSSSGAPAPSKFRGSEDTLEFMESIKDLRNVEPFVNPPGLDGLAADLGSNLPFQTRASSKPVGVSDPITITPLSIPDPPTPPVPPVPTFSGNALDAISISRYSREFQDYLIQWEKYYADIVTHFETRRMHYAKTRISQGASGLLGDRIVQQQLEWERQDREVRTRWMQACDQHELQVIQYLEIKMSVV